MTVPPATQRLAFREWKSDDVDSFHGICRDVRVMQYVGDGRPWSVQKTQQFVQRAIAMSKEFGFCQWPLINIADSTLIGFCGFVDADDGAEIGWRLAPACWGQGLATEAASAVMRHGFETLKLKRIVATVQPPNRASIRVVEKLGLQAVGTMERQGREVTLYAAEAWRWRVPPV